MENNSVLCKLKISKNSSNRTPPFLVQFANANVNLDHADQLKFETYRHIADDEVVDSQPRRILFANNDRLNYEIAPAEKKDFPQREFRYCIGVRKKNSTKMKVYDTVSLSLQRSRTRENLQFSVSEEKNIADRFNDLTASFGSKTRKRMLSARQKYSADNIPMDSTLENLSLDESVSRSSHSISVPNTPGNNEYIPPQNRNASSLDEVYNINDIISKEEDEILMSESKSLLECLPGNLSQLKEKRAYCEYVMNHLEKGVDSIKARYLIYFNYLVIFSRLKSPDMKKRNPLPEVPEYIRNKLMDCFTVSSITESGRIVRHYPSVMKDKLLAYILVLALFIDNYSINLSSLQGDLKYSNTKFTSTAQALGCHVSRPKFLNSCLTLAVLKLPLYERQKFTKNKKS